MCSLVTNHVIEDSQNSILYSTVVLCNIGAATVVCCISLINTPVPYYLNTNNIDTVVTFISSAPSNSIACHFATPGITANYCITMVISSMVFKLYQASREEI